MFICNRKALYWNFSLKLLEIAVQFATRVKATIGGE